MHPIRLRHLTPTLLVSLAASGLLAACATTEESARLEAGWKSGYVQAIGTSAEIGAQHARLDCRPAPADADPAAQFVQVRYANGRLRRSVIAPMQPGQDIGIGQQVWVNSHECRPVERRSATG
ncbi:hypothetical protein [Roseateles puraquae]|jgi:hypothetical protein|uniref:hypothetical protein n=1 Tax=Roseateles puraquae TaxID=431059 RepID=UPI0031DA7957